MNKFDEAIEKLRKHDITKLFNSYTVTEIVEDLRQEHAPTVEMTQDQKDTLINLKHDHAPISFIFSANACWEIVSAFDEFWEPLTEEQLMRAWLDPNVIKVVEEEQ
ncbi:hypothetical protein KII97_02455 [Leuconostoc gelidum subsp. gasicomitatum]|uniref:hypothetical protein n=1 Tax=Leuconostoc gasicomitatum TaxID=115778 RepID=UPI001CC34154|nr:hypothetical protein [Leuconostoc gasicomitatum]MBZ5995369.1 hypothetical protein [Leuconostoc gasicomitatum]